MTSLKWILPVLIFAFAFVILIFKPGMTPSPAVNLSNNQIVEVTNNQAITNQEMTPESANADVDAFAAAVISDAQYDQQSFDEEGNDVDLFNLDDQAINDLSQSYDENEF